ncbi:MAG: excinuclease ABC subunit UvrC [Deltaproteobacteria bacterium]|nr:excinuclease ABC subunit UvrC [Deltaproteobacteria bacterium]
MQRIRNNIKFRLRSIARSPGVYLMKDAGGAVVYVGKAKNLRARVCSYFRGGDSRERIGYLVEQVSSIDTIVTSDEREALILESDLIKKYQPRYNVRLKDDKAYLVIRIDLSQRWPRLEVTRQVKDDGAKYFGPYAFGYEVQTLLEIIKKTIPLRTCSDNVLRNRVRPCLEYQIKRCLAPCCNDVDFMRYQELLYEAMLILEGKHKELIGRLRDQMERVSSELRFEDAAVIRDSLLVLETITNDKPTYAVMGGSRDAIGFYREGQHVEISLLMIRRGRIFDARTYGFSEPAIDDRQLIEDFLSQYYTENISMPEEVLLPFDIGDLKVRSALLTDKANAPVKLLVPKGGERARLVQLTERNAKENFCARHTASVADGVLTNLKTSFNLADVPQTIECIDISHFQGSNTVGAVVHFAGRKPDKGRYRVFHVSAENAGNDFGSMNEVLKRHLSRCAEENTLPDLLIIDGGEQQLAQGLAVKNELGLIRPEMVSLAKKRNARLPYLRSGYFDLKTIRKPERVFIPGHNIPVLLRPNSAELNLIERIRDETHRFVITFHRKVRARGVFRSVLDNIAGLGDKRKVALLREFGSLKAIARVEIEDLMKRGKLPQIVAERVLVVARRAEQENLK